ncbi:hypothetical protein J2857_003253 [Neorhizobium galegae]|uniref:hypothetical protein n=1 Tax=Neorhizobium galegae TaxID=399 RepID=UPI001AEAA36E|nr:hypothetical protein [Neorhizobium galegae]MBP2560484.1 hypothetical protein [Neorhizobium galegae]
MTTIASTSYYNAATRHAGSNGAGLAKADDPYGDAVADQGSGSRAGKASAATDSGASTATISFMGKVVNAIVLDRSNLKAINVAELPEDQYQQFMEVTRNGIEANKKYLESQYTERTFPDYSNDPRMKTYATITIAGRVVATIDNQGVVTTASDALGERVSKLLKDGLAGEANVPGGPASAQFRAEKIAELLGGRIVKASTAMTQRQYNAMPPFEGPTITIDYEGMKNAPLSAQIDRMIENYAETEQKRAEYLSRQQGMTA